MPFVTVTAPVTAVLRGTICVPEEAMDDIQEFLFEHPEFMQTLLDQGRTNDYNLNLMDLQIVD